MLNKSHGVYLMDVAKSCGPRSPSTRIGATCVRRRAVQSSVQIGQIRPVLHVSSEFSGIMNWLISYIHLVNWHFKVCF